MRATCVLHGEQVFVTNGNKDSFCPLCLAEKRPRNLQHENKPDLHPRCFYTKNPCGTDTWAVGYVCSCAACQKWFHSLPKERQEEIRWGVGGNPLIHG